MPKEIKYGFLRGPRVISDAWPVAASVVFTNTGGKFVRLSSNRLEIAGDTHTIIIGSALTGALTASATAGQTKVEVDLSFLSVYRLPTNADPANVLGELCDLIVASNIQQAAVTTSSEDIIRIVAADTADDTVDVHLWWPNVTGTGVV